MDILQGRSDPNSKGNDLPNVSIPRSLVLLKINSWLIKLGTNARIPISKPKYRHWPVKEVRGSFTTKGSQFDSLYPWIASASSSPRVVFATRSGWMKLQHSRFGVE